LPILTNAQVYAYARQAGFNRDQATTATAIANAESGRLTTNIGDTGIQTSTWGPSLGVWQIRSFKPAALAHAAGADRYRDPSRLRDPAFNAAAAFAVSNKGRNWAPWATYTSGDYKPYLPDARAAAALVEGGGGSDTSNLQSRVAGLAASGQNFAHLCLVFVREALGVGRKYGSADEAYNAGTRIGGNTHTDKNPRPGCPCTGGRVPPVTWRSRPRRQGVEYGHPRARQNLAGAHRRDHAHVGRDLSGWQETVNDVKVYSGPTAASVKTTATFLPASNTGGAIGGALGSIAGPLGTAAGAVAGDKLTGGGGIADRAAGAVGNIAGDVTGRSPGRSGTSRRKSPTGWSPRSNHSAGRSPIWFARGGGGARADSCGCRGVSGDQAAT